MEELDYGKTEYHYTCGVCGHEFNVPWAGDFFDGPLSPEMIEVIEHEEQHRENGEEPAWELFCGMKK